MLTLKATIRKDLGKKVKNLRKMGLAPAVLYGPKTESLSLEINLKEFEKIYAAAGGSSLITLAIAKGEDEAKASSPSDNLGSKKFLVLIHAVAIDVISQKPIHIDFYQPRLDEEITASVPLVFEGESLAVKDLGGTLVKNIHEVQVKALPQNLPHEIKVNIEKLKTLQDVVLIKDLILSQDGVKIIRDQQEIVASVVLPEKVEEELAKPVEEKVEEVEKVGGDKKGEEEEAEKAEPAAKSQEKTK